MSGKRDIGLSQIQFSDPLWHIKIGRNLLHLDENIIGQAVVYPLADPAQTAGVGVVFSGGQIAKGRTDDGVLGVLAYIRTDGKGVVQLSGAVFCPGVSGAATDYLTVDVDGTLVPKPLTAIYTEGIDPAHIIGTILEVNASGAHVLLRNRGVFDWKPLEDKLPVDLLYPDGDLGSTSQNVHMAAGSINVTTNQLLPNYGCASVTRSGNVFIVQYDVPFAAPPFVKVGLGTGTRVSVGVESGANQVRLHCGDLSGVSGTINFISEGLI